MTKTRSGVGALLCGAILTACVPQPSDEVLNDEVLDDETLTWVEFGQPGTFAAVSSWNEEPHVRRTWFCDYDRMFEVRRAGDSLEVLGIYSISDPNVFANRPPAVEVRANERFVAVSVPDGQAVPQIWDLGEPGSDRIPEVLSGPCRVQVHQEGRWTLELPGAGPHLVDGCVFMPLKTDHRDPPNRDVQ